MIAFDNANKKNNVFCFVLFSLIRTFAGAVTNRKM